MPGSGLNKSGDAILELMMDTQVFTEGLPTGFKIRVRMPSKLPSCIVCEKYSYSMSEMVV